HGRGGVGARRGRRGPARGRRRDRAGGEDRRGALGGPGGPFHDLDPRATDGARPGDRRALPAHPHLHRDRHGRDRRPRGLLPGGDALYAFTIEFPVRPLKPAPPRPTHATLVAMPVLIVSGEPEQRLALSNLLRGWRMVPLEADNAPMAMALLERMHQEGTPIP